MATVRARDRMNIDAFGQVLRDIRLNVDRGEREICLDFSSCEKAYPDGMLPLIATLAPLRWVEKCDVSWIPPENPDVRGLFDGAGWSRSLSSPRVEFVAPPPFTGSFTPASCFSTTSELKVLHDSIMQVLVTRARLALLVAEAAQWALWEIMENVLNHSTAPPGIPVGWVQASSFPKHRQLTIVVVDTGRGLASSLETRYGTLKDNEAIKKALEEGGTSNPHRNKGYGLTGCRNIAETNRGQFEVWSGEYLMDLDCTSVPRGTAPVMRYRRQDAYFQGTLVELSVRTDRAIDLAAALGKRDALTILEQLHDTGLPTGEFRFDIAMEAADLGTRESGAGLRRKILNLSQAEPDDRILLDFAGVAMLSSSFADECVAKLALDVGKEQFFRRFGLVNVNPSVEAILQTTMWGRLA